MTRDEVISLFHKAGEIAGWKPGIGNDLVINYLTQFAELVAKHEREAIIALCAELDNDFYSSDYRKAVRWMIKRIRKRGDQ